MEKQILKTKGKTDYDDKYDILFFKAAERAYDHSVEIDNFVVDIDKESYIVGIQIFEASEFFNLSKKALLKIPCWKLKTEVSEGKLKLRVDFQVKEKQKLVRPSLILTQALSDQLPDSELVCEVG